MVGVVSAVMVFSFTVWIEVALLAKAMTRSVHYVIIYAVSLALEAID